MGREVNKSNNDIMTKTIAKATGKLILLSTCLLSTFAYSQDFELADLKSLSIDELMDVEVTSVSKRKERISQAASAIQVITNEDIINSGATNLPEALKLASNLQVAQVNACQWAISARGFNNVLANKLLILIDGRVVYTPMYGGVFWDVQNLVLEDIDRIEVISGPGGTLWGANAMNGVINIITKHARNTQGLYVEAAGGTELRALGSLRYGGEISEKLSYRVYGTAFRRGNTIFRDSVDAGDDWQMTQGGLRVDWAPDEKNKVSLISNLYDGRPDPDGDHPVVARGSNVVTRWNHTITDHSDYQVQAFYDKTWRNFRNGFAEKLNTYDIEGQHRFQLAKNHEVIYGVGFRVMDHDVTNIELLAFKPGSKTMYLSNAFVQDEISVIEDKLRVTLGLKVEHNTYTEFQYQPNARLSWHITPSQTLWSAVSYAVRNPSRIDRDFYLYVAPEVPLIVGGNFKSETLVAYELGWRMQTKNNLLVTLSTFYNNYDNIRSVEPGPEPLFIPFTLGNGVRGDTYGVELSATHQVTEHWRLRGGYTFMKKDLWVKPGSADRNNASAESNDPDHQAVVQSTLQLFKPLTLGSVIRYVGELPDPPIDDYVTLDLQLTWKIAKSIQLNITGQNLLQDHHTEFIPSSPAPKDIERSIYGKVIWRL
jgi:iron complex outermembrane recepter protein